jgi:hypothetical protein
MENEIVKKEVQQSFIERLVEKASGLNEIKQVGEVIIASGFCPDHFRQSKDAVGVIMCIEAGRALGMSWMQALSDLYPVKGRIGMMGDAAVALIMGSGVLEYWHESTEGTYPNLDYKHVIVSKRKGFPTENTSEFSVFDAKTAGLMSKDIYQKYGKRMIRYRNAGFHARDYFSDILKGMKTVEELEDYDNLVKPSGETKLTTAAGKEISIDPNKAAKSETISNNVTKLIDKANGVHKEEPIQEAEVVPDNTPEAETTGPKVWTNEELADMKEDIYEKIKGILPKDKVTILESLKGRRSNKLYRDAVLYFQNGNLDVWLIGEMSRREKAEKAESEANVQPTVKVTQNENNALADGGDDIDKLFKEKQNGITTAQATASFESQRNVQQPALFPEEKEDDFEIPPLKEGKRGWSDLIKLSRYLQDKGVDKASVEGKWETFLTTATNEQILALIPK